MYFFTFCTHKREVQFDAYIVMPNHAHGVILLKGPGFVGATGGSPFSSGPSKYSLGAFIAGFKAASTKRINAARRTPKAPVWQRNYYDHIIRDERSLTRIREYILNNRLQWDLDPENPNKKGDHPVALTAGRRFWAGRGSFRNGR